MSKGYIDRLASPLGASLGAIGCMKHFPPFPQTKKGTNPSTSRDQREHRLIPVHNSQVTHRNSAHFLAINLLYSTLHSNEHFRLGKRLIFTSVTREEGLSGPPKPCQFTPSMGVLTAISSQHLSCSRPDARRLARPQLGCTPSTILGPSVGTFL